MAEPTDPSGPVPPADPAGGRRDLPRHVTTPLLARITEEAIDQDYEHAAAHRASSTRRSRTPAVVAVTVLGLMLAVAAVETAEGRGARESNRASLIAQAQQRRELLGAQQARLTELRGENLDETAALGALTEAEQNLRDRVDGLAAYAGYEPVSGPGVRVEVRAADSGDPADDMTLLLDGLWNAGAEAIAVNGRRITTVTRIASTGQAVSIDGRSLDPPYTVLALGDPDTLPARFAESGSGATFTLIAQTFFLDLQVTPADDLELPAATLPLTFDLPLGGPS